MFNDRELSIRMNKADRVKTKDDSRDDIAIFEDRVAIVHTVVSDVVKTTFAGVLAYVMLDTFRQVLVAINTHPHN